MKRSILIAGAGLVCLLAFTQIVRQFTPVRQSTAFTAFPIGKQVPIQVDFSETNLSQLTPRQQTDQVRDWLFLAALSNSGLDATTLNEVTFDLPAVRYGYLRPVSGFEYGATRSRVVGDGIVIALIPSKADQLRLAYLSDIADEVRKSTGVIPKKLYVFEYVLPGPLGNALLKRTADVDGNMLFNAQSGYHEAAPKSLQEFNTFFARIDDLTYSELTANGIKIGGRRIPGGAMRPITAADVAALWQAQSKLITDAADFEQYIKKKEVEFNVRWSQSDDQLVDQPTRKLKMDAELQEARQDIRAEHQRRGIANGLGFSLDPTFDFPRFANFVERDLPLFLALDSIRDSRNNAPPATYSEKGDGSRERTGSSIGELTNKWKIVANDLRRGRTTKLYEELENLDPQLANEVLRTSNQLFGLQAARYDGDLRGTEPGMILFYTDLLAKLWAINYSRSAPEKIIDNFVPMTRVALSPIYQNELRELSNTRLWFGPQRLGFQVSKDGNSLLLARIATRLYAASATALKPGEESEANAQSSAFLGWWDDHFQEVANYEPEYERLNQVMKWSLVLAWLQERGDLAQLDFLKAVPVEKGNWFPDWARKHPELRFSDWNQIHFNPRGHLGLKTESLPLLMSETYELFGESQWLRGGVSLAERKLFTDAPRLSSSLGQQLRRSNLKYADDLVPGTLRNLENVEYRFATQGARQTLAIHPPGQTRLRDRISEIATGPIDRSMSLSPSSLKLETNVNGITVGGLDIHQTAKGFAIGWKGREFDVGHTLALRLSKQPDLDAALATDKNIASTVKLADGDYLVQTTASSKWLRIASDSNPTVKLEGKWHARVGDTDSSARGVKFQWLEKGEFDAVVQDTKVISVQLDAATGTRAARMAVEEGIANGALPVEIMVNGKLVKAVHDQKAGRHYFRWGELPPDVQSRPALLQEAVAGTPKVSPSDVERAAVSRNVARGEVESLARSISRNPLQTHQLILEQYRVKLDEAGQLLNSGKPDAALLELNRVSAVFGETTEINVLRGLTYFARGETNNIAQSMKSTSAPNGRWLFDEFSQRISRNATQQSNANSLRNMRSFYEWNGLRKQGALPPGDLQPRTGGSQVLLDFHAKELSKGQRVALDEIDTAAPLYLQDHPSFRNLDWSVSSATTLKQAVDGGQAMIVKLPRADIAHFRPSAVYVPHDTAVSQKVKFNSIRPNTGGGGGECHPDLPYTECSTHKSDVYFVVPPNSELING